MTPNTPACLQAPDGAPGQSEVLSEDGVRVKAKQESRAIQLQATETQLKCDPLGPYKFAEPGKDFSGSTWDLP